MSFFAYSLGFFNAHRPATPVDIGSSPAASVGRHFMRVAGRFVVSAAVRVLSVLNRRWRLCLVRLSCGPRFVTRQCRLNPLTFHLLSILQLLMHINVRYVRPHKKRSAQHVDRCIYCSYSKACLSSSIQPRTWQTKRNTVFLCPCQENSTGKPRWCGLMTDSSTARRE